MFFKLKLKLIFLMCQTWWKCQKTRRNASTDSWLGDELPFPPPLLKKKSAKRHIIRSHALTLAVDGPSAGRRTCNICPHQNIISITSLLSLSLSLSLLPPPVLPAIKVVQLSRWIYDCRPASSGYALKMFENNSSKSFACTKPIARRAKLSTANKKRTNWQMILFSTFSPWTKVLAHMAALTIHMLLE